MMQLRFAPLIVFVFAAAVVTSAQTPGTNPKPAAAGRTAAATSPAAVPPGYVIGADDVLSIVFWRDKEMSADVVVRPDGHISLPLLNDVRAAGLTPEQLREELLRAASKYIEDPTAAVVVKEIKSRNVFITGNVARPDRYPLTGDMNVMQLIALAGGLQEYADSESILILRTAGGKQQQLRFNYKDVLKLKRPEQNVVLQPGDTVVVP
jgi:polysaccharide export outer membrane protein